MIFPERVAARMKVDEKKGPGQQCCCVETVAMRKGGQQTELEIKKLRFCFFFFFFSLGRDEDGRSQESGKSSSEGQCMARRFGSERNRVWEAKGK